MYFKVVLNVGELRLHLDIFFNSHIEHSKNLGMDAVSVQTFWHAC